MRAFSTFTALVFIAASVAAQPCPNPSDTYWQRDTLPQTAGGTPLTFSVIPGLCQGEAAAVVFELPAGMPPQQLTQVVCPFGAAGGASGAVALVNLEVYDGVTFSGGTANMGTQVFDLNAQTNNDMQVTSTAFNTLDVTQYNIVVGNNPVNRKFAIAFRMSFNTNGNCTSGYTANFFTDNTVGGGLFCNPITTPAQTSLIFILGQGWRDAAQATVSGFPLCPLFYAGTWGIRCCTTNAAPANPFQITPVLGVPAMSPGTTVLQLVAPGLQGVPYQFGLAWGNTPGTPVGSQVIPLNYDSLLTASLDPALSSIFVNFTGTIDLSGNATVLINVPVGFSGMGVQVFGAWVGFVPTGQLAISDEILIPVQ